MKNFSPSQLLLHEDMFEDMQDVIFDIISRGKRGNKEQRINEICQKLPFLFGYCSAVKYMPEMVAYYAYNAAGTFESFPVPLEDIEEEATYALKRVYKFYCFMQRNSIHLLRAVVFLNNDEVNTTDISIETVVDVFQEYFQTRVNKKLEHKFLKKFIIDAIEEKKEYESGEVVFNIWSTYYLWCAFLRKNMSNINNHLTLKNINTLNAALNDMNLEDPFVKVNDENRRKLHQTCCAMANKRGSNYKAVLDIASVWFDKSITWRVDGTIEALFKPVKLSEVEVKKATTALLKPNSKNVVILGVHKAFVIRTSGELARSR